MNYHAAIVEFSPSFLAWIDQKMRTVVRKALKFRNETLPSKVIHCSSFGLKLASMKIEAPAIKRATTLKMMNGMSELGDFLRKKRTFETIKEQTKKRAEKREREIIEMDIPLIRMPGFQVIHIPRQTTQLPKGFAQEPAWWTIQGKTIVATDGSLAENTMKGSIVFGTNDVDSFSVNVKGGSSSYISEMGALFAATKLLPTNRVYTFLIDNMALKSRIEKRKYWPSVTNRCGQMELSIHKFFIKTRSSIIHVYSHGKHPEATAFNIRMAFPDISQQELNQIVKWNERADALCNVATSFSVDLRNEFMVTTPEGKTKYGTTSEFKKPGRSQMAAETRALLLLPDHILPTSIFSKIQLSFLLGHRHPTLPFFDDLRLWKKSGGQRIRCKICNKGSDSLLHIPGNSPSSLLLIPDSNHSKHSSKK